MNRITLTAALLAALVSTGHAKEIPLSEFPDDAGASYFMMFFPTGWDTPSDQLVAELTSGKMTRAEYDRVRRAREILSYFQADPRLRAVADSPMVHKLFVTPKHWIYQSEEYPWKDSLPLPALPAVVVQHWNGDVAYCCREDDSRPTMATPRSARDLGDKVGSLFPWQIERVGGLFKCDGCRERHKNCVCNRPSPSPKPSPSPSPQPDDRKKDEPPSPPILTIPPVAPVPYQQPPCPDGTCPAPVDPYGDAYREQPNYRADRDGGLLNQLNPFRQEEPQPQNGCPNCGGRMAFLSTNVGGGNRWHCTQCRYTAEPAPFTPYGSPGPQGPVYGQQRQGYQQAPYQPQQPYQAAPNVQPQPYGSAQFPGGNVRVGPNGVQVQTPRTQVQVNPNQVYVQTPQGLVQVQPQQQAGSTPAGGFLTPAIAAAQPQLPLGPPVAPASPGVGWSVEYSAPHAKITADASGVRGHVGDVEINVMVPADVEPPKRAKKPRPKK